MKNAKNTKRALLMSVLSMMLCLAMLVGSTFAWFTDSVTSGMNKIVAGNLDVELYHTNGYVTKEEAVTATTKLFLDKDGNAGEDDNGGAIFQWEPGAMVYENFTVKNAGSLALKYELMLNAKCNDVDGKSLDQVLRVAVLDKAFNGDRAEALKANYDKTVAEFVKSGAVAATGALADGEKSGTCAIIIYWLPTEADDLYNFNNGSKDSLYIDLGINLSAWQDTVESDSFSNDYDNLAELIGKGYAAAATIDDVNEALAAGKNIVLTDDIEISSQTPGIASDTVTIDLNGKTLTAKGTLALKKEVRTYMTQEDYDQLVESRGKEYVEKVFGTAENCVGKYPLSVEYQPVEATLKNGTYIVKNNGSGRVRFETGSSCVFENVTFKSDSGSLQQAIQVYVNDANKKNTYVFRGCTFVDTYVGFDTSSSIAANYDVSFEKCSFNINKPTNFSAAIKFARHTTGKLSVSDCSFNIKTNTINRNFAIYHEGANGNNQGTLLDVTLNNVTFIGEKITSYYGMTCTSVCIYEGNTGVLSVTETGTNSYVLTYGDETIKTDCWGNE